MEDVGRDQRQLAVQGSAGTVWMDGWMEGVLPAACVAGRLHCAVSHTAFDSAQQHCLALTCIYAVRVLGFVHIDVCIAIQLVQFVHYRCTAMPHFSAAVQPM